MINPIGTLLGVQMMYRGFTNDDDNDESELEDERSEKFGKEKFSKEKEIGVNRNSGDV